MNIKILNSSKEELELEIASLTIAEILREYLNQDSAVAFAAWRRAHPTDKPILLIRTKNKTAKKALNDAISAITKELDKLESDFSKLK